MRKNKRQLAAGMMASVMVLTTLAGCGASASSNNGKETNAAQTQGQQTTAQAQESQTEETKGEPVEMEWLVGQTSAEVDDNAEVVKMIEDRFNIDLKAWYVDSNKFYENLNVRFAGGEMPDVLVIDNLSLLPTYVDGGIIGELPIEEIREKAPNYTKVADANDDGTLWSTLIYNGKNYGVTNPMDAVPMAMFWRKDWLDKLGLEVPTTVDELHDVLYAFRNEDPNGNGLKDEVPLFDRAGWKMPEEYLYLWDTSTTFYPRDGKMTFEPLEENFKTGVKGMIQWYEEGILDPEFFTRGSSARDTLLSGNLGGCTHDWVSAGNYNTSLADAIPGFEMVPFAPPADQNGNVKERVSRYPGAGWGISSMCSDPETVIKFMDYFFTEEGDALMNWGIEGDTYTVNADGTRQFTDKVLKSELTPIGYLRSIGSQYRIGMCQDGDYEKAVMTEIGKEASDMYDSHPEWFGTDMPPYADGEIELKYTAEDDTEYKNIMASIQPYVEEKFQSWVLGVNDFEADYEDFIAELKARGIDRALEINQQAYDTYLGKN